MPDIDQYDYQRYAILFVDDEEKTRKYFRRLFGEKFRILEAADGVLYIPQVGRVGSFNVAVAAAIVLAEARRQEWASMGQS